jgi:hypothetical protein
MDGGMFIGIRAASRLHLSLSDGFDGEVRKAAHDEEYEKSLDGVPGSRVLKPHACERKRYLGKIDETSTWKMLTPGR